MKWKDKNGNNSFEGTVNEYLEWKQQTNITTITDDMGNKLEVTPKEKEAIEKETTHEQNVEHLKKVFIPYTKKQHKTHRAWSKEEEQILKDVYITRGIHEARKLLPNRTINSITSMATKLRIRTGYRNTSNRKIGWTNNETKILKENKNATSTELMKLLPNRSIASIKTKMWKINNQYTASTTKRNVWTRHEDKILKEQYHNTTEKDILKLLPGRTYAAIKVRVSIKKIRPKHTRNISDKVRKDRNNRMRFLVSRARTIMGNDQTKNYEQAYLMASSEWQNHNTLGTITSTETKDATIVWEVKKYDSEKNEWTTVDCFTSHLDAITLRDNLQKEYGSETIRYLTSKVTK